MKIKKGLDKRKSLRVAKLEFIKEYNPVLSNPFYWASFVVYGDVRKIEEKSFGRGGIWGLVALLILCLIIRLVLKNKLMKKPSEN